MPTCGSRISSRFSIARGGSSSTRSSDNVPRGAPGRAAPAGGSSSHNSPAGCDAEALTSDLTLHNDVLFALLVVCQSVLDISGELAGRRGIRFQDFTGAVRTLAHIEGFSPALVDSLALLAGFRDILVHEYIEIDYARVIAAVERLEPVDEFIAIVGRLERGA